MSLYRIPVTNLPNQTFNTSIPNANGDNIIWIFKFIWNTCTETWEMSLFKGDETNPIALHIPIMVTDNLLSYMDYKEDLGIISIVNLGKSGSEKPNTTNLGSDYIMLWDNLDGSTMD